MAVEFDIQGPTRVCAATGKPLSPGDRYVAVLADRDGSFVRTDYTADAWPGPPDGVVAYWSGRVPATDTTRRPRVNDDLLFDCFDHLAGVTDPARANFRYVVALLLMRRRRLKFEDHRRLDDGTEIMLLRDARSGDRHDVADPRLGEDQIASVQTEVFQLLGWEA
ncbi:MAG TPA: hypothetical protein VGJ05_01845 [Fimbriiglobus sp.]